MKYKLISCLFYLLGMNARAQFNSGPEWLKEAVFYQIYPQSFFDTNSDGIGDLNGITLKLDYLKSLGINAIWLNPVFESPFRDAGYDVSDYYSIAHRYGSESDLRQLLTGAHNRGIRVVLDLVAGHTSDEHPWFKASQSKKKNDFSARYIWAPNSTEKRANFVDGAFQRKGSYLKNFFDFQPALNFGYARPDPANSWEQPVTAGAPMAMRNELKKIIDFWMKMGVDGFRVDMASTLIKNDSGFVATRQLWHDMRKWFSASYPEGVLIAEWSNPKQAVEAGFMVDFMMHFNVPGYPSLFFNNEGVFTRDTCYFDQAGNGNPFEFIRNYSEQIDAVGGNGYVSIPTANHDINRPNAGSRNTPEQLKVLLTFLLTIKGIPFIYYGDEIGMKYLPGLQDKEGSVLFNNPEMNRAGSRTPMQWRGGKNAGFSESEPNALYLPIDSSTFFPNVADQKSDPGSLLNFTRFLITLRKKHPVLGNSASIRFLNTGSITYPLSYVRELAGERMLVVLNPSGKEQKIYLEGLSIKAGEPFYNNGVNVSEINGGSNLLTAPFSCAIFILAN